MEQPIGHHKIRLDTGQKKILISVCRTLPDELLDKFTTARIIRCLADQVEDFHDNFISHD